MALPQEMELNKMAPFRKGPQRTTTGGVSGLLFDARLINGTGVTKGSGTATYARATIATYVSESTGFVTAAASGEARFEANGYLPEGQRTNLCGFSEDFSDAVWTNSNMTVASDTQEAPDGNTDAQTLTAADANATLIQDLGTISSAAHYGTLYLLRKTGSGDVQVTLDNGTAWTTVTINASTWTRVGKTQTLANPDFGIRIVTDTDAVWAWGAQTEAGAFPSSYVPVTDSSTVTRNKDTLTYQSSGNIETTSGTIIMTISAATASQGTDTIPLDTQNDSNQQGIGFIHDDDGTLGFIVRTTTTQANVASASSLSDGVSAQLAGSWIVNSVKLYYDGTGEGTEDTSATMMSTHTIIRVGEANPTDPRTAYVNLKNLKVFDRVLTAAEIASL